MYENNIKLHYIEYVERYINVVRKKKETIATFDNKQLINEFCSQLRKIKNDILAVTTNYTCDTKYHKWIKETKIIITPNKATYKKNSLYYDLQCNPQDYLPCMIRMMQKIEKKVMIYNVFPMRNDLIMKSIKLDTTTLIHLLIDKDKHGNKDYYLTKGNLKIYEDDIWNFFFRTERQCFKNSKYTFHHMIETDGVSCTILMLRNDMIGKRIPHHKIKTNREIAKIYNVSESTVSRRIMKVCERKKNDESHLDQRHPHLP